MTRIEKAEAVLNLLDDMERFRSAKRMLKHAMGNYDPCGDAEVASRKGLEAAAESLIASWERLTGVRL